MNTITANEIKTKGVVSIGEYLKDDHEAIITVRGKQRYIVMDIEHYQYLRECELEAALLEAKNDMTAGDFVVESVEKHMVRIKDAKEL